MTQDLKTALTIALQTQGEERVAKLREALIGLGISADKSEELAGGLDNELRDIANSAGTAEKKSIDLVTALKTLAGAAIVREFFQVNAQFESMQRTLTLVTGSSAAAAQEMAFVKAEANRLGIETASAAASYVNLAASAKGTNLEGAATRQIWSAVVGTMAALGKSSADVEGAITQLGQGISKGRFELEDLKSIAERIPGFFKLFADQLGVTTEELFDMISAGELTADKLPQLAEALQKVAGPDGVEGANASLARLKNAWTDVQLSLGETGGLAAMTTFLKGATVAVATLWEGFEFLGRTVANVAYTLTSLDFAGYRARQKESLDAARGDVSKVIEAMFGAKQAADTAGAAGQQAGQAMAAGARQASVDYKALGDEIKAAAAAQSAEVGLAQMQTKLGIEQQRTLYEVAKAKGDVAGQTAAKNKISELEIELSRLQAQAAVAEATASLELAQAKYQEALAKNENVAAAEAELTAAGYTYAAKSAQADITEELISRTGELTKATASATTNTFDATGATLGYSAAVGQATTQVEALAEMEEHLADIRDRANAARQQGGSSSWEYILGSRGIELSTEQLRAFKDQIESVHEYLRGTFDGQVVSSTYLLEEAIRRTVDLVSRGDNAPPQTASGGTGGGRTSGGSAIPAASAGGVTVIVQGDVLDVEALARKINPELTRLNRYLS